MGTEGRQINKSAIRNFAIEARNILIRSAATEAGFYGITKDEMKKWPKHIHEVLGGNIDADPLPLSDEDYLGIYERSYK